MTIGKDGKPHEGNPHVRLAAGAGASETAPRRGSLLYRVVFVPLATVAISLVSTAARAAEGDDLWFFADFDSTPVLDGDALLAPLPQEEIVEGRFGRACAFRSHFWEVADPVRLRNFPREEGSFSCFFRSEESALTNGSMNVIAYCGFWTYNWGWGDGSFRTSGKVPGMVQFRYLKGGSPVKRKLEWQHFAATWNRDALSVYLNGEKFAEKKNPQIDDIRGKRGERFEVGSFGDGRKATKLVLDDVAVFRRVLGADEIRELASGARRPRASAPPSAACAAIFRASGSSARASRRGPGSCPIWVRCRTRSSRPSAKTRSLTRLRPRCATCTAGASAPNRTSATG